MNLMLGGWYRTRPEHWKTPCWIVEGRRKIHSTRAVAKECLNENRYDWTVTLEVNKASGFAGLRFPGRFIFDLLRLLVSLSTGHA